MCAPSVSTERVSLHAIRIDLDKREGKIRKKRPDPPYPPTDRSTAHYFYAERVAVIYRFLLKFALTGENDLHKISTQHTAIFHCDRSVLFTKRPNVFYIN